MDLPVAVGKLCLPLKVCMAPSFVSFCLSIFIRWKSSKGYDHRKVVLCRIKLWNCCSSILWPCGAPLAIMPCWQLLWKSTFFPLETTNSYMFLFFTQLLVRPGSLTWHKLFYESIETQRHTLSRSAAARHWHLLYLLIASKQVLDDQSVKPHLAVLDHAQIIREVMSVYQSSF